MEFKPSKELLNYYLEFMSKWAGLPPKLLTAIAMVESSYNPKTGTFRNVCNSSKACGLMQIKPIAVADIKRVYGWDIQPLNPISGIIGGALMFNINRNYLRKLAGAEPNIWALVVAYNGGWTQGRNYMRGLPIGAEQTGYVQKVYNIYFQL